MLNERFKKIREDSGLSMRKFALKIGVSPATVSMIESGQTSVQKPMAKLICKEFNVNEEWLLTGEGDMYLPEDELGAKMMAQLLEDDSEVAKVMKRVYERYMRMDDDQKAAVNELLDAFLNDEQEGK